jgi:hypothetical protein
MSSLQALRNKFILGNHPEPKHWKLFLQTKINEKSLPIHLEYLDMNEKFNEMDEIFMNQKGFVECFKIHMNSCGFPIRYDFTRIE